MKNHIRPLALLGTTIAFLLPAAAAYAQATRTWVSGVGDDVNPCSRTAPCKTFAGAISKTASGGEIDVLDPGGFGTVTITKSITIDGSPGSLGSILNSGTNGINVNVAGGNVILRNLSINGAGTTNGINGINILAAASVLVQNSNVFGNSQNGILLATAADAKLVVENTTVTGNTQGGVQIVPSAGAASVTVTGSFAIGNGFGIGVAPTATGTATVIIDHTTANENSGNGAQASGAGATLLVSNSAFSHNSTGITITSPANSSTFQNNLIAQNLVANTNPATLPTNTLK